MPTILQGSWETGDEGWVRAFQFDINPEPLGNYRISSGARTGSWCLLPGAFEGPLAYPLPPEANLADITVSFWANDTFPFGTRPPVVRIFAKETSSSPIMEIGLSGSIGGSLSAAYRQVTYQFSTDGEMHQYFISPSVSDEGTGRLDDWSISYEPILTTSTYVNDGGIWKPADKFVNDNGIWKSAITTVRHNGVWKEI